MGMKAVKRETPITSVEAAAFLTGLGLPISDRMVRYHARKGVGRI
jgi:hypothetical protein